MILPKARWSLPAALLLLVAGGALADQGGHGRMRATIAALGGLTDPPVVHPAEGFAPEGILRPLFYEGATYRGAPTRVFAWLGVPAGSGGPCPGVVLVHGGGGTAFKEWVQKWNQQGFAAIAMSLEGHTDLPVPDPRPNHRWQRHPWAGPVRPGIYADSGEALTDQWIFQAVANVVRAHSLLRSVEGVNTNAVGVCGISWGGIVVSTVVGIDTRFAFGIPIYGCGALDQASNQYGRATRGLALYEKVWNPVLWLPRAKMPLLWLTGQDDAHFSLEIQQISYRAAGGPRMVSVPFGMKHGGPPGWNQPESYAFARAVVESGRPWGREIAQTMQDGEATAEFESARPVTRASLVFRSAGRWSEMPARLETAAGRATARARIPAGTTLCFFNLDAGGLTISSEVRLTTPTSVVTVAATPSV